MRELPLPTLPFASLTGAPDRRRSLRRPQPDAADAGVVVHWAASQDDVRAAQRLRFDVSPPCPTRPPGTTKTASTPTANTCWFAWARTVR